MKKRTSILAISSELDPVALEHELEKERARKRRVLKQEYKERDRRPSKQRTELRYDEE